MTMIVPMLRAVKEEKETEVKAEPVDKIVEDEEEEKQTTYQLKTQAKPCIGLEGRSSRIQDSAGMKCTLR